MALATSILKFDDASLRLARFLRYVADKQLKLYLFSPGNYSRSEYEKLAVELGADLKFSKSVLKGLFRPLSFIFTQSQIGLMQLKIEMTREEVILKIAENGYVVLIAAASDVESKFESFLSGSWSLRHLPNFYQGLASDADVLIINAENPDGVEISSRQ